MFLEIGELAINSITYIEFLDSFADLRMVADLYASIPIVNRGAVISGNNLRMKTRQVTLCVNSVRMETRERGKRKMV